MAMFNGIPTELGEHLGNAIIYVNEVVGEMAGVTPVGHAPKHVFFSLVQGV